MQLDSEPRLREVERKLDKLLISIKGIAERFENHERTLREMKDVLFGDGNGKRGMLVRIDRLEQSASRANKLLWLLFGAAITATAIQFLG